MTPRYAEIEQGLLERIQRDFRRGDLLPTQKELAREYSTSLITIKRALDEIARKGMVRATRGRGTVVTRPQARDRGHVSSWGDTLTGLGRQPGTASIDVTTRVAPPAVARALGLKARDRTVLLQRLRTLDGEPIALTSNELPLALVPELAREGLGQESLYVHLKRRYGLAPARAEEEVQARAATDDERRALGDATAVVIVIRRHTFLSGDRPLEVAQMIAAAQRFRYRIELVKRS